MQDLMIQSVCLVIMFGCFLYYFKLVKDQDELIKAKNATISSQLEELKEINELNTSMSLAFMKIEKKYEITEKDGEYTVTEKLQKL